MKLLKIRLSPGAESELNQALLKLPPIPTPVTKEWLATASKAGMILKADLKDQAYYTGDCRNANVAKWDKAKNVFIYLRSKFGAEFEEEIYHPEDDDGHDLFIPIEEIKELTK